MRRISSILLLMLLTACSSGPPSADALPIPSQTQRRIDASTASQPLIIVGQGGPSNAMVRIAARTYQREHGGVLAEVSTGDEFIAAMQNFVHEHGKIGAFAYFGHGNSIALFVNQVPGFHGSMYANDPRLVDEYAAASIYELPSSLFARGSRSLFFGCNVAENHPAETFASAFANHFNTVVVAATGPTEFSRRSDAVDPYSGNVASAFDGPVYMVPANPAHGFIEVRPSDGGIGGYSDVTENLRAAPSIQGLRQRGLSMGTGSLFIPYQAASYADAVAICFAAATPGHCKISVTDPHALIRNTEALALFLDAFEVPARKTPGSSQGYVEAGFKLGVLIPNFTHKRWLTRAELAELGWRVRLKIGTEKTAVR